jgi:glycosyltransferase involved in cell wall biosynthesis
VRGGDRLKVLTPHAQGVAKAWNDDGVAVESFRYAPERLEVLGYSRSLSADETVRGAAGAVAPLYALAARAALKAAVSEAEYDLVHAHWVVPNGVVAGLAGLETPLAVGLHGSDVFMAEKSVFRPWARLALRRTSLLTGCSPELVDRVCEVGFDGSRSVVIPYGVDVELFSPDPDRRPIWRQKLDLPADAVVGLGVGRMVTKKGFHVLVPLLGELFERFPEFHLVLAGGGDRLEEFRQSTSEWSNRVHFPDVVLRDTLPDLYRAADFFVLPAVHDRKGNVDGLPNVILEGMASGLPILASAVSGIPLAVTDGEQGLLVEEKSSEQLADALKSLLGSPSERARMGAAARRKACAELTWDVVAGRYRQAYESALSRRLDGSGPGASNP